MDKDVRLSDPTVSENFGPFYTHCGHFEYQFEGYSLLESISSFCKSCLQRNFIVQMANILISVRGQKFQFQSDQIIVVKIDQNSSKWTRIGKGKRFMQKNRPFDYSVGNLGDKCVRL